LLLDRRRTGPRRRRQGGVASRRCKLSLVLLPLRLLYGVLEALGLLAAKPLEESPRRPSMRLVALPAHGIPADPLRQSAEELVRAFDAYVANVDRRFDRRYRHRLGREDFFSRFGIAWSRARKTYCRVAMASRDPLHHHVAQVFEADQLFAHFPTRYRHGSVIGAVRNWLREEPRVETESADPWIVVTAPILQLGMAGPESSYRATLVLEMRRQLPPSAVLRVDVGAEVDFARVLLLRHGKAASREIDSIWRQSRVWVPTDEAQSLREGDRIEIRLSSMRPIAPCAGARIGRIAH
jgi:hypothetical protein